MGAYAIVAKTFVAPSIWETNLVLACGPTSSLKSFNNVSLIGSGMNSALFGAYLGIVLQSYRGIPENKTANFWQRFLGLGLTLTVVIGTLAPYLVIPIDSQDPYVVMVRKNLIPSFLGAFGVYGFYDDFTSLIGALFSNEKRLTVYESL